MRENHELALLMNETSKMTASEAQATSRLTIDQLQRARDIFMEEVEKEAERRRRQGYWDFHFVYPRSKKRRIRTKWLRSGRALRWRWVPPSVQDEPIA
jgi:hypothetical protein